MPTKVICSGCGYVLAEYKELPGRAKDSCSDLLWLGKLREKYWNSRAGCGVCPNCGHKLAGRPIDVEVKEAK